MTLRTDLNFKDIPVEMAQELLAFARVWSEEQSDESPFATEEASPFTSSVGAPVQNPHQPQDGLTQRDGNGVPFNPALHSEVQKLNADGSWKMRRGVDKAQVKAYAAQFAKSTAQPTAAELNAQFQAPPVNTGSPFSLPAPQAAEITTSDWVARYMQLHNARKTTVEMLAAMQADAGVNHVDEFQTNADARARSYDYMARFL